MKTLIAITPLLAMAIAGCGDGVRTADEKLVTDGISPAVSPDGKTIAFQRHIDNAFWLGKCPADGGEVTWIERGPAQSAYPAWAPDGSLVYTYGEEKLSSFEAAEHPEKATSYGLRVCGPDGRKRDLLVSYARDYLPEVSADGKWVYFTTTRSVKSWTPNQASAVSSNLARVPLAGGEPEIVLMASRGHNSAVAQLSVSPDGKRAVWAQLTNWGLGWELFGSPANEINRHHCARVSPDKMIALSPRWHPSSRLVAFTGFMKDDPCWGVWVMDAEHFGLRRLCSGENPCFSSDGKWLYYERDRKIYRRGFAASDWPTAAEAVAEPELKLFNPAQPERTLWRLAAPTEKSVVAPAKGDDYRFRPEDDFYVRAKFVWDGQIGAVQMLFNLQCEETSQAIQFYISADSILWFSSRKACNQFNGTPVRLEKPGVYEVVGVRSGNHLAIVREGALIAHSELHEGSLPLMKPQRIVAASRFRKGTKLLSAEFGRGSPKELKHFKNVRGEVWK